MIQANAKVDQNKVLGIILTRTNEMLNNAQ